MHLHNVEVNFFSYWDVTGVGNEKEGHVYRGISYSTSEIQRRYLSIVVNDDFVQPTLTLFLNQLRQIKLVMENIHSSCRRSLSNSNRRKRRKSLN